LFHNFWQKIKLSRRIKTLHVQTVVLCSDLCDMPWTVRWQNSKQISHEMFSAPAYLEQTRLEGSDRPKEMKLQLLWTATPPQRSLCILGVQGTKTIRCVQRYFIHLYSPGLSIVSFGCPGPAHFCRPSWFFKTQVAVHQVVIGRQFCTPSVTKVQHWLEQVSWNYAEINDWRLTQWISAPGALVQISVLEVFIMHSTLLQNSCSRSLRLWFTSVLPCWPITSLIPQHRSQRVHWSLTNHRGFVSFNPPQGINSFFHEVWE